MQVRTYLTRNFATLGPSELRPPFTGPSIESFLRVLIRDKHQGYPSLLVTSTGQASDPIHDITILLSPVFLINSRHPLFCAALLLWGKKALLIPKLRSQFAEFLQHGFLYRLGLLNQFTCVGLGTVSIDQAPLRRLEG